MSIGASAGREEGRERDEASENARQGGDACPAVSRGGVYLYMLTTFTRPCRLDGTSPRGCHCERQSTAYDELIARMPKVKLMPMPQAQADKLIAKVAQPLPRHYNGQGYGFRSGLKRT